MRHVVTTLLALALLLSGVFTPSVEAACDAAAGASTRTGDGCASPPESASGHHCCCEHPATEPCPCEVAPAPVAPQPLENGAVAPGSERPVPVLGPCPLSVASPEAPRLRALARSARQAFLVRSGPRLHLLFGVLLE